MPIFRLLTIFACVLSLAPPAAAEPAGMVHLKTALAYPVLIERLDAAAKANGLAVVTRASATVGAKRLGKTIPGNMVVGVFHPRFAIRMLAASVAAGYEAPIRFYITETPGGVTLSYRKPTAVFAPYTDGGTALSAMAAELDVIFARIAAAATR